MTTDTAKTHRITWWVYAGSGESRERIRHTASMRGQWGYDATCACGWDSRTGGALRRYVESEVWFHKFTALDNSEDVTR